MRIHAPPQEVLEGDTTVVDRRIEEEDEVGKAIAELERLGTDSQGFRDSFEKLRRAVITPSEAEEHEELPELNGILDEYEVRRMRDALSRVLDLASRNGVTKWRRRYVVHGAAAAGARGVCAPGSQQRAEARRCSRHLSPGAGTLRSLRNWLTVVMV